MNKEVLLLAPSRDLGGGIERYVQTVQSAFAESGVAARRLDLARPGPGGHRALLAAAGSALATMAAPVRVVIAHRALLPVAALLAGRPSVAGISVICHGSDVWGSRWQPRWQLERRLMRGDGVRVVAASSFTAGALFPGARAAVLPPGLSRPWFAELVRAGDQAAAATGQRSGDGADRIDILTAFRLSDWRDKGLPQLTAAIAQLGRADIRLTVCGSGAPPAQLLEHVRPYPWCALQQGLTDGELAAQFAQAELFVLATRTRPGPLPCGEGFGLVLLEAQVAGTAVIGPAHGGSPDAYLEGVTGVSPRDETVTALAQLLSSLADSPARRHEMGARGAAWSRERFAPEKYAKLAIDRLL